MEIWLRQEGEEYGPYTLEEVKGFVDNKETSLEDEAWFDGCENYKLVLDIPGLGFGKKKRAPQRFGKKKRAPQRFGKKKRPPLREKSGSKLETPNPSGLDTAVELFTMSLEEIFDALSLKKNKLSMPDDFLIPLLSYQRVDQLISKSKISLKPINIDSFHKGMIIAIRPLELLVSENNKDIGLGDILMNYADLTLDNPQNRLMPLFEIGRRLDQHQQAGINFIGAWLILNYLKRATTWPNRKLPRILHQIKDKNKLSDSVIKHFGYMDEVLDILSYVSSNT
jgi:hypothetical protein